MTSENNENELWFSTPIIHFWFWCRPSDDLTVCVLQKPWSCLKSPRWHKMTRFTVSSRLPDRYTRITECIKKRNWLKISKPMLESLHIFFCTASYELTCCQLSVISVFPWSIIVIWTMSDNPTLKTNCDLLLYITDTQTLAKSGLQNAMVVNVTKKIFFHKLKSSCHWQQSGKLCVHPYSNLLDIILWNGFICGLKAFPSRRTIISNSWTNDSFELVLFTELCQMIKKNSILRLACKLVFGVGLAVNRSQLTLCAYLTEVLLNNLFLIYIFNFSNHWLASHF